MDLDLDLPRVDDDIVLPEAEAFPTAALQAPAPSGDPGISSRVRQEQESSDSAEAPLQRKRRAPKILPVDERPELHNTDLTQWKTDYIANMAEATAAKVGHKAPFLAKRNAAFWVLGAGIGGVGAGLGSSKLQSPLAMFAGASMIQALTGVTVSAAGQKRGREDEEDRDSDSEGRRARIRDGDWEQIGRGEGMVLDDDGIMMDLASNVSTIAVSESFQKLTNSRESKLVVKLRQHSKILPCHGIRAQPSALVKAPLFMVAVSPAALVDSLPVLAPLALCHLPVLLPARWGGAPVESLAPVLSSAVDANVTVALGFLPAKMMTSFLEVTTSLTTKRLTILSSMVPPRQLIPKQLVNHNG